MRFQEIRLTQSGSQFPPLRILLLFPSAVHLPKCQVFPFLDEEQNDNQLMHTSLNASFRKYNQTSHRHFMTRKELE